MGINGDKCRLCLGEELSIIITLPSVPISAQCFLRSDQLDEAYDSCDLTIAFCQSCGHVQALGDPVEYFRDVITASTLSETLWEQRSNRLKYMSNILNNNHPNVLEIGSGKGANVKKINEEFGYNCVGLEHSISSVEYASLSGIPLIQGYLGELDIAPPRITSTFDIVVCYNFLEHMPSPLFFIRELKKVLNDKALLNFTVPSLDFILTKNCIQEFIQDHLSYFTLQTLEKFFRTNGFEVLLCEKINRDNDIEIIASYKRPKTPFLDHFAFNNFTSYLNHQIQQEIKSNNLILFWGAGHRSLTLISQLDYNKISYIIDSASFKQGLFSPVSHIPIISPDTFYQFNKPTSLFLSLPGIYSTEVIHSINQHPLPLLSSIYQIHDDSVQVIDYNKSK